MTKHVQAPSIDLSEIESELENWWRDLNLIVGPLALTMAIGCKSLSFWPGLIFSVLAFFVLLSISSGIKPRRNTRLAQLQELAKHDKEAAKALKYANNYFLGKWRYFSCMAGCISLPVVAGWHVIGGLYASNPHILPWLTPYLPFIPS